MIAVCFGLELIGGAADPVGLFLGWGPFHWVHLALVKGMPMPFLSNAVQIAWRRSLPTAKASRGLRTQNSSF